MKIPNRGKLYSVNEGHEASWDQSTKEYVRSKKYPEVRDKDESAYLKIIVLISQPKHILWVLKRTVSMRRLF